MLSTLGLQLSEGHRIISLARDSISPFSENVNSKIKKSLEDVEGQPMEEPSDGTAMQNYSRAIETLRDTTEGPNPRWGYRKRDLVSFAR